MDKLKSNEPVYFMYNHSHNIDIFRIMKPIPPVLNPYHRKAMDKGYGFQKKGKRK